MKKWNILGGMAAVTALSILAASPVYAKDKTIPEGIYVGEFSLGGMTEAEAQKEVKNYVDGLADQKITIDIAGQKAETTAKELGFAWSNQDAVKEAASHAAGGNLVQQYMGQKDLEKNPVHVALETAVDEAKVDEFLKTQEASIGGEPKDATITRVDGKFQITPGQAGQAVDAAATKAALDEALSAAGENVGSDGVTVTAEVTTQEPKITEKDLESISDVLGTFTTDFSSSGAARSKNLANGAGKINGHVLMPGETLSGYECMQPFTTDNGYFTAAAYENGQVVDSVGGGVCQIATTLYNASLLAELEITQRQNHSMIVGYVKPSMDAAIAGTYKDIKVTNNYSTPIYVEGGTADRKLTFTIYGKETRPANRQISFESETLATMDPGAPQQRVDNSLAPGARKQVQSAHRGLKSRLWKIVTVDGKETERTKLSEDTYNAAKAIVLVGPAGGSAHTAAPAQPVETAAQSVETQAQTQAQETQPAVVEGINGGPGVKAPAAETQAQTAAETQAAPVQTEAAPAPTQAPAPAEAPAPAPAAPAEAPAEAPAA